RPAAHERIDHPVAWIGRHRQDTRDEALRLLVPREDHAALTRDALERDVVPDVRERLDDRGPAVEDADLVGEEENAVPAAHDEGRAAVALEHEDPLGRGA